MPKINYKMADEALKKSGIKIDNKALQNTKNFSEDIKKIKDKEFIKRANKKLKGFKYGVGVGM